MKIIIYKLLLLLLYKLLLLLLLPIIGNCQNSTILLKHQISISVDNTVLNHPLQTSPGLNVRYNRALIQNKTHRVSAIGSSGLIHTPKIDNRLFFGVGGEYAVHFLKRFSMALGLQANYLLTVVDYDLYEYNSEGTWMNKGNLLHKFIPSSHLSLGGDLLHRTTFKMGAFLELRMMQLNESAGKRFMEGYVPTVSIGLKSNF